MSLEEQNDKANDAISARLGQLNSALEKAEEKLQEMKLPCDVWHDIYRYTDEDTNCVQFEQVGMAKLNGDWTLSFRKGLEHPEGYTESTTKPYRETSIENRLTIANHIDGLRKAVVKEKERVATDIEKALEKLGSFLEK